MKLRDLGETGIKVSPLGLGTVKFGRNTGVKYPNDFEIPDDKKCISLLSLARDLGINTLDTAPAYGVSEERLGKLLKGQRKDWIIVGKAGENYENHQSKFDFRPTSIRNSIEISLKKLKTDYIDLMLIHSDGNDEQIIKKYNVFDTLNKAKRDGLIRSCGMSSKTVSGGLLTLEMADVAMVTYNLRENSELEVIKQAEKLNKGILIKKSLHSGHEANVMDAFKLIFAQPAVSSAIIGTINPGHLTANVAAFNSIAT